MTTTELKDNAMTDPVKNEPPKTEAKADAKAETKTDVLKSKLKDGDQAKVDNPGGLAPAGQSGDPVVQKLLAEREIHRLNGGFEDDEDAKNRRAEAKKKIDEIDKELEKLGFTAK